jgi:hypothetical protein
MVSISGIGNETSLRVLGIGYLKIYPIPNPCLEVFEGSWKAMENPEGL